MRVFVDRFYLSDRPIGEKMILQEEYNLNLESQ